MGIAPISNENIKVGYISEDDGYVKGKSIAEANAYEALNPGTVYIFLNGDNKVKYLTIDQVNSLTSKDLLRSDPCKIGPQACPPPTLEFYGGGGVGAEANPVVDRQGNLLAADLVNGGFGYETPPFVTVVDPCRSGNGAVLNTEIKDGVVIRIIINETGTGYLPPKAAAPQYPAILQLSEVRVNNPGINYDCGKDEIVIEPANGTQLSYVCEPFGKISSVKVLRAGNFTELPAIRMKTNTGLNASFTPVFNVVRDPQPIEPVAKDIVQVFDLVGLNVNGYVGGKEYYGNVYFKNGVKFAGTSAKSGTDIRVFESREASISGVNVPVTRTVRQDQTIRSSATTPTTETETVTAEPSITQPSTYVPPSPSPAPAPAPAPAPSPAPSPSPSPSPTPPPSPPPSGGGGYGGY